MIQNYGKREIENTCFEIPEGRTNAWKGISIFQQGEHRPSR